jgi:tRNA nucleotidyltransferase (CCA-adding enzyme)
MLRLARYASRLGFSIEPHTAGLVQPAALHTVSGPRIGTELRLLARERDPVAALHTLHTLELDRAIHPAFGLRAEHEDADLARRALALLPDDARPDRLALAAAARHLQLPELERLLDELAFEAADRDAIIAAATRAQPLANELAAATKPSEIAGAVANAGAAASPKSNPELVALAGALGPASQARAWLDTLQHTRLDIDGADLIAAGVPQGPDIGAGLRAALQAKLDGRASGAREELEAALRAVKADG